MFKGYTIVTDMDGTLLNSEGILSKENIDAINEFVENGGKFTVATGRMLPSVEKFIDRLNINMPAILYNGGKIYDFTNKKVIYEEFLEDEKREIIRRISKEHADVGIEVYIGDVIYAYKPCKYTDRLSTKNLDVKFDIDEDWLFSQKWVKILLLGEPEVMDKLEDIYKNIYKAGDITRSGDKFLEILPSSTSKGQAVEYLCQTYDLSKEKLFTFGDAMNDVELLSVTENGYCVANGAKRLKKIAKNLEISNDENIIEFIVDKIKNSGK